MRTWRPWMLALLMAALPAAASGQDVTVGAGGFAPAFLGILVPPDGVFPEGAVGQASVSFGSMLGTATASVRFPLRPHLWLEGEWTRAAGSGSRSFEHTNFSAPPGSRFVSRTITNAAESRATNVFALNLLRPVSTGRVSTVFGVGAALRRTDASLDYEVRCEPIVTGGCDGRISEARLQFGAPETGVTWQALMGIDAAITDRASLLWNVRWMRLGETSYEDAQNYGFAIDARLRLRRAPRERSSGPPRIIRDAALAGLVAGGFVGVVSGSRFEEEGRLIVPLYSMGIGLGAGALLGLLWR